MKTFTVLDENKNAVASGEKINDTTYRVYLPKFLGGFRDFTELSELFEATGGYAMQDELLPKPIPTHQLTLFPEK